MEWLSQNWVWVLFLAAFIAMPMFGHGRHGEHSGHGGGCGGGHDDSKLASKDSEQRTSQQG